MVPQDVFVAARSSEWSELDALLLRGDDLQKLGGRDISRIAALYRAVCKDVMRCRAAHYSADLSAYLDGLAGRAHNVLYSARASRGGGRALGLARLVARDFPRTFRRRARFFALSAALFVIPWVIGQAGAMASNDFALKVMPAPALEQMAEAYAQGFADGRATGADAGMAGFYVYNNVGIAFRCFATGVLFGAGSVFFLVYNGLVIGTSLGHVIRSGSGGNMLTFICGHAPFELTAIVISGAAGLQMGYALVATGGRTRLGSLRSQAREIAHLVLGAALMLLIAAVVEGFWSPSAVAAPVKWAASGLFTLLVVLYFALAGRGPARAEGP
ncbi:membrane protein [Sorangium cellulosum]|uniref:Membrane protein n=1 Tax=Sorangium cellulosum TaxID=56 RepID=A0A2L0EUS6_SORCE|nr:stage II sporulation protein M [Sorangium cellulosum]AUX43043.1 membrane protein [Sorangium cellulosum]